MILIDDFRVLLSTLQSEKVASVQDALERLSMKEHVEGYTDTKTKVRCEYVSTPQIEVDNDRVRISVEIHDFQ